MSRANKPMVQQLPTNTNSFNIAPPNRSRTSNQGLRIINEKPEDKEKKTVAVIITFCNGGSYDPLFTSVEQKAL